VNPDLPSELERIWIVWKSWTVRNEIARIPLFGLPRPARPAGGLALLERQALPSNSPEMVEEDQSRLARMSRRAVPRFEVPGGSFFAQTAGDQAYGYIGTGTLLYGKDGLNLLISAQHNTGALCVRSV
jgi:hypothetical protein